MQLRDRLHHGTESVAIIKCTVGRQHTVDGLHMVPEALELAAPSDHAQAHHPHNVQCVDEAPLPEVPVLDENAPIPLSHTSGLPFGCPLDDAEKALAFVRAVNAEFNFFRPGTWSRYWTKSIEDDIRRAGRNPDEPRRGLIIFEDEIFAAVQAEFGVRI